MVAGPCAPVVTRPFASIGATVVSEELHVTLDESIWLLPSEYRAFAVYRCKLFTGNDKDEGRTAIDDRVFTEKGPAVKVTPLVWTVRLPVLAPLGTGTVILVEVFVAGVASVPLNVTILEP
jgi:hypothetical protein